VTPQSAFDLTAYAARLGSDRKDRAIAQAIRSCISNEAIRRDLVDAKRSLELLAELDVELAEQANTEADALLGRALMSQAITLYSRATHTESRDRGSSAPIRKAYAPEQKAKHDRIIAVRNYAIAHWGRGGDPTEPWVDLRMAIVAAGGEPGYRFPYEAKNYAGALAVDLHDLLIAALAFVERRQTTEIDALDDALVLNASPAANALLLGCKFDPVAFFRGRPEVIDAFWKGHGPGDFPSRTSAAPKY
jgi:hypothetical protein